MDEIKKQRWIRLFSISDRSLLEQNLNRFLKDFPEAEIRVWTKDNSWFAQVMYSYPDAPTYNEPDLSE
jgi:hypothetical protein